MERMIDETELDRLEALAGKASKRPLFPDGFDVQDDDDNEVACCNRSDDLDEDTQEANAQYIAATCNAVPAMISEIRRLREKVEAWEWFEECFEVMQWLMANGQSTPESRIVDVLSSNARVESLISTNFARERAVHADRE